MKVIRKLKQRASLRNEIARGFEHWFMMHTFTFNDVGEHEELTIILDGKSDLRKIGKEIAKMVDVKKLVDSNE